MADVRASEYEKERSRFFPACVCGKIGEAGDEEVSQLAVNHHVVVTVSAGVPLWDGTYITAVRTAAAAALSVRLLSRKESRVATIIGAGVQGKQHLRMLPLVRNFEKINLCTLRFEDAQKLAAENTIAHATADLERAVGESDVVCLATHSAEPVIEGAWVAPGTHVTSVGYHPPQGELPRQFVKATRLFVETIDAFEPPPVGCSELSRTDRGKGATMGAVILGRKSGRQRDDEITLYKAMGIAMEDMVAANLTFQRAKKAGVASEMEW